MLSADQRAKASARATKPRRSKGEGSIFQTTVKGVTVWRATCTVRTDEGKRKIIAGTSPSKSEAIARRDRLHRKWLVEQGLEDPAILIDKDTPNYTLGEWLEQQLEGRDPEKVQANTRQRDRGLVRNHINPHLGSKRLSAVTEAHINELLRETLPNKKDAQGNPQLGSSPIRGIYYILRRAFTEAERQGLIKRNPTKYIDAPKKTKKHPLNLTERGDDVTKIQEYLLFDWDGKGAKWILAFYGLRASERLGLEWSSITNLTEDIKKPAILTIDRQLYNDAEARRLYIKHRTKTDASTRQFPLPDDVRATLIYHRLAQLEQKKKPEWKPKDEFKDLIYTTATGNAIRQSTDNTEWRRFIAKVGLKPLRGHDMRHLTASWLARTGVPAEVAKTLLGHNSAAMTSYYTHIAMEAKGEAITLLNQGYDKALDRHLLAQNPLPGAQTTQEAHEGLRSALNKWRDRKAED